MINQLNKNIIDNLNKQIKKRDENYSYSATAKNENKK